MPDVSIGRLRGGFCVYWDDPQSGKRRRYQLAARTRKDAEAEAIEVYRRHLLSTRPADPKVRDIWDAYLEYLDTRVTAKAMKYMGVAVLPHFGALRPDMIDRPICLAYEQKRYKDGVSTGTVHTELGHLNAALRWGAKVRMIREAPHIWRPSKPERDKRILDREEAAALIKGAREPHTRLAIILLLGTGARVGALLDLTWDRVNFENNSINLRRSDSVTRKGRARVPMNGMVRAALLEAREAALSDHVIEFAGKQIGSIKTGFKAAVQRSGIGHVRIHDMRHTAAVTMLSEGVPIEKVAQMLGHSNTSMTYSVYGRYLPGHMQDAADVLDFTID